MQTKWPAWQNIYIIGYTYYIYTNWTNLNSKCGVGFIGYTFQIIGIFENFADEFLKLRLPCKVESQEKT